MEDEIKTYISIHSVVLPRTKLRLKSEYTGQYKDYDCISVGVPKCECDIAKENSEEWLTTKSNNRRLCEEPEYCGLIAELAFSKLTGLPARVGKAKNGRCRELDWDFRNDSFTVDVKAREGPYANMLILQTTNLKCDYYVPAKVIRDNDKAMVCLFGYIYKNDIPRIPRRARQGTHNNYEVPYEMLSPIQELLDRMKHEQR